MTTGTIINCPPFRDTGSGTNVLFVHGWLVSGRVWDLLLPQLAGFRCIVPDLSGGAEPASLDGYLAELGNLLDFLDLDTVNLVGHSMGGQLAMLLAAKHPERFKNLALLNPVPVQGMDFPEDLLPLFRRCGGQHEHIERIVDMSCRVIAPGARQLLISDALSTPPSLVASSFDAFREGCSGITLDHIAVPTVVVATDDAFLSPAFLADAVVSRLPNARLTHLAGAGHYPQLETPEPLAHLLGDLFR